MQADGFLQQKQRHPLAMTAAIAINLSAVAAVLLAKSGYIPAPKPTGIPVIDIFTPPPPEPIDEIKPQPRQQKEPVHIPRHIEPSGETGKGPQINGTPDYPPKGDGGGLGDGAITPPRPDPTPIPILTQPAPLASAAREFQPPYPPQLLRTGVEGAVVVRVLVGTDGRVKQVAILSADDPLFADATERQALRKWRFKPATRDGIAIEAWKQMTVRFQINS